MTPELTLQPPRASRLNWSALLEAGIPVAALILIVIATAICEQMKRGSTDFLSAGNMLRVLQSQAPVGMVAIGMTFIIISGGIDLSVGSMLAMAGTVGMFLMIKQKGSDARVIALGLPVMIAIGVLAGLLNGLLVAKGRIAPFIATLGGLAAYRSVATTVAENGTLNLIDNHCLSYLGTHGIPLPFLHDRKTVLELHYSSVAFILLAILGAVVLNRMRFGRYVFAVGGNERAAAYSAINVDRVKILTYALAGLCVGISSIFFAARQCSISSPQDGQLFELDAIAAVVIGGTRISGGSGGIFGTVMGVLILGVINSMLNFLNIPDTWQGIVKGGIIVGAALVQQLGRRRSL